MYRGARHVLAIAEQLEVFQRAIRVIAVFPPDAMPFGDWPMRRFPHAFVNELPGFIARAQALRFLRYLDPQIAVAVCFYCADRKIVLRPVPFSELRLAHSSAKPARAAKTFVWRNSTLWNSPGDRTRIRRNCPPTLRQARANILRGFVKSQLRRSPQNRMQSSAEDRRNFPRRLVGKLPAQDFLFVGCPQFSRHLGASLF